MFKLKKCIFNYFYLISQFMKIIQIFFLLLFLLFRVNGQGTIIKNISYGPDSSQQFDYWQADALNSKPVLLIESLSEMGSL